MASEPLNVLVVSHAAVIPVNQEPFDALGGAGARVTLVAPAALHTDLRGLLRFEPMPGLRARAIPLRVVGGARRWLGGSKGIHVIAYLGLRDAIARAKPDVVFVEEEPHSVAARQVARTGARFVVHENQNIVRPLPFPFSGMRRRVLARASGVTVRNEAARSVVGAAGFGGPIGTFPHAAPIRAAAPAVSLPKPVIGFVGRLVPEKGIEDLLAACEGTNATILVVGDGPLRSHLAERAAVQHAPDAPGGSRRGDPRLHLAGAVAHEDMPAWYAAMDLAVVPSRTTRTWKEQFGRVVIEANAAGVPVVVSDSGELPRTVATTGGGMVVPEGDVRALRDAIAALLGDEARRRALGEQGRAAVEKQFSFEAVGARLYEFLREVCA